MKSGRFCPILVWFVGVVLLLTSCGSGGGTSVDAAKMEELGNAFVAELSDIIHRREDDARLLELGTLTVIDDKTYRLSSLDAFYEDYRVGAETELILIYRTKSFVVNKFVFDGSTLYHFRYELNPTDVEAINIEADVVDEIEVEERLNGDLRKVVMKYNDVIFTFENIMDEEETETAS